jgi:hypothetical protein
MIAGGTSDLGRRSTLAPTGSTTAQRARARTAMRLSRRSFMQFAAGLGGAAPVKPVAVDVRSYGASGDGRAADTAAVNRAIAAAASAGGGTVNFPPGTYRCGTIHLRSRVDLYLASGATILAGPPGGFDAAEPNPWSRYQDFGHDHFHNSLICGDGVEDISIRGLGLISGKGLSRDDMAVDGSPSDLTPGVADKVIALKNCRNVALRDFSIFGTGHFGILATGVDNLSIDRLTIDTGRDGINIDSCWGAEVTNCVLNTPNDDSISLKASYALGDARGTRDVVIRNCHVTGGYKVGTLLDGSRQRLPDGVGMRGRIKLGTESVGDFANIVIENCSCRDCLGLALETVDGGKMQNITVSGVKMSNIGDAPFFLRLGARLRAPVGTAIGAIEGVTVDHLKCCGFKLPVIVCGIPGHPIRQVTISDVHVLQEGSGVQEKGDVVPPEEPTLYPESSMFGPLPAQLLYARHVHGLKVSNVAFDSKTKDLGLPFIWLDDVRDHQFTDIRLPPGSKSPEFFNYDAARVRGSSRKGGRKTNKQS